MGMCGQPGYVFRDFCRKQGIEFIIFCLNQGIDLSIFVLNRINDLKASQTGVYKIFNFKILKKDICQNLTV